MDETRHPLQIYPVYSIEKRSPGRSVKKFYMTPVSVYLILEMTKRKEESGLMRPNYPMGLLNFTIHSQMFETLRLALETCALTITSYGFYDVKLYFILLVHVL